MPWKRPPGKQSEVDDGENEVKAEELSVVPNIGERELARDRWTQVLGAILATIVMMYVQY